MGLVQILILVGALLVAEAAPRGPGGDVLERCGLTLLVVVSVGALAFGGAQRAVRAIREDFGNRDVHLLRFAQFQRWRLAAWGVSIFLIFGLLNWGGLVRYDLGLGDKILLDELLILLPPIASLVLSWCAFYDVDRTLRNELVRRGLHLTRWSRLGYVLFQFRGQLGLALAPLIVLLGVQDVLHVYLPAWETGKLGWLWLWLALPAVLLIALLPEILRRLWRAERLPEGELRARLERAADRLGLRVRDIFIWPTRGTMVNAAVSGVFPPLRYVFLTDGLLAHLTHDEVEAVFAHEIGHLRHHHLALRAASFLAPLALLLAAERWFRPGWFAATADTGTAVMAGVGAWQANWIALLVGLAAWLFVVFGYYSRRLEEQADLFAAREAWSARGGEEGAVARAMYADPADEPLRLRPGFAVFCRTLDKLAELHGGTRRGFGWLHGSIAQRVAFLEDVADEPRLEQAFERRLRRLGAAFLFATMAGLGLAAAALV